MTIDPFRRLVEEWDARHEQLIKQRDQLVEQAFEIDALQARVRELEDAPPPVEPPPPGPGLPVVPFTEPPLKLNRGSWDKNTGQVISHGLSPDGALLVWIGQQKQPKSRVIRHDYGLQDPAHPPGQGPHWREPKERLRRYELRVKIPADYSGRGELCTLGIKMHTHAPRGHAYIAFIAWTTTVRWRINHPDGGGRKEGGEAPVKRGHTYALAVEAFWSQGPNGVLRAWTDGKLVLEHKGPNYSKDESSPPYLLVGAYFPSAIEEFSEVFEFSDLRIGDI